jgi:hypothetical protein
VPRASRPAVASSATGPAPQGTPRDSPRPEATERP